MKVQLFVVVLWTLVELPVLISSLGLAAPYRFYQTQADSSVVIAYNRSNDIEKHCSSFLSSASELKPDENWGGRLKNELSFYLGDWEQENDGAPLMQLDDDGIPESNQSLAFLLKLVSFEVKDVNSVQQLKNTVSLGGVLSLGISRNSSFPYGAFGLEPRMYPGSSVTMIVFEGVYMETKESAGERLMCLVGSSTSTLPSTDGCDCDEFSDFASSYISTYNNHRPRYLQDDQILLVLRYPKTFKLTKSEIQGEMTSLNKQGGPRYFSKVHISSQLTSHSKYHFNSELLQSRASDPLPYKDELMEDGVRMFTDGEFCRVLNHFQEVLNIVPNYRFSSSYMKQIRENLGPFLLGKERDATGGLSSDDIKLIFQHVKCEQDSSNRAGNAKVFAVLRAVPKGSSEHFERLRTGLSGLTLTAEGIWNSSSGQLFMVGCHGKVDSGLEGCDYEIAMYFPRAFSIKQRSTMFGTIFRVKKDRGAGNPLFFNAIEMKSSRDFTEFFSYNYSKIKSVKACERRTLPYQILSIVKQSLFQYPALNDAEEPLTQLRQLFDSLALNGYVVPDQLIDGQKSRVLIEIEVLSLGPLSGWHEPNMVKGNLRKKPVIKKEDLTGCRFLNVSLHLEFKNPKEHKQTTYKNVSELSLEGLYDPILGEMHLIGCRKALVESIGIERGQDCLIEVEIQYPPINLLWWKNPTAKMTIRSQRQEDDPLHFSMISLHAHLTHNYPDYFERASSRVSFEAILCILLLAGSIAITWSQLLYMKVDADVVPYISTSMLAFQILGYSLPLVCGAKVLFKSKESEAYGTWPHGYPASGMYKVLESFRNVLLLVALLLAARLLQMVTESRSKPHSKGSSKIRYAYKEKQVILITMAMYSFGFLIWFVARENPDVRLQPGKDMHAPRNGSHWQAWMAVIEDFVYFVQDFFLLPQILRNLLMLIPVKSLRKTYFLGFTSIRLLVHFFDYVVDPIFLAKVETFEFLSPNSTSPMFAKVAASTTIIMTAIIVYIQQNWKYQKHVHSPKQGAL